MIFFRGEHWDKGLSPEELQEVMSKVMGWCDGLQKGGRLKAGQPLGSEGRVISGQKNGTIADGPFAESKEAVGGYLLIEAKNLDEAVAIAKSCPTLRYGITIEVRNVLEECPVFERVKAHMALATA